jgi:hypothetical protein
MSFKLEADLTASPRARAFCEKSTQTACTLRRGQHGSVDTVISAKSELEILTQDCQFFLGSYSCWGFELNVMHPVYSE